MLHGLSLTAQTGRVLAILGRIGAEKSTTLNTIMVLLLLTAGEIVAKWDGGTSTKWTMEPVIDLFPRLGERLDNGGTRL